MKSTTTISRLELGNLSYLVFVILDGVDRILGHMRTFESAVRMVLADADRFEDINGSVTLHITDRTIIARYANGVQVEYRIDPSDRQIPEDEPSADDVDADLPIDLRLTDRALVAIGGAW